MPWDRRQEDLYRRLGSSLSACHGKLHIIIVRSQLQVYIIYR